MANKELTLGSLFSGSGGFELGGILAGIKPVFSSEIEPFPIRVTEKRLPEVKHYGDVNKLNGADLPPVDIITFGSPCQDMSIAGKRTGLDGLKWLCDDISWCFLILALSSRAKCTPHWRLQHRMA